MSPTVTYRFGPFVIDPVAYRLVRDGAALSVSPKVFDLLLMFVREPSRLLTKEEIFRVLWPDVAVTDNALTQVVSELRQALGDSPASPQFLQTVARRGYRFIATVEVMSPPVSAPVEHPQGPARVAARPGERSIVVLDFANMTDDAEMAWLAAGLAETITNDLRAIRDLRVIDRAAARMAGMQGVADGAKAMGIDLAVVGSFQRSGDRVRITARAVDLETREALAHAKADGPLSEVFALQDAVVTQLSAGLQIPVTSSAAKRISERETSSLAAYRAATEGRLKLETLDPAVVPAAIVDFERALALDSNYAMAHVGLAHARFWVFQASRARNRPAREALDAAIGHARRAVEIDPELAEAHAALAFFLAFADRHKEALAAGRLAVAIEPANWRHQFRLGMAAWGSERIGALDAVLASYPRMAFAHFGTAMVYVARGDLRRAEETLEAGLASEGMTDRFPANGLHWMLGLIRLRQGDRTRARFSFDRELASAGSRLFADEFAMDAFDGHGFALLAEGDFAGAAAMFEAALERFPQHARSLVALAEAYRELGAADRRASVCARADAAIRDLAANGRDVEAAMAASMADVVNGHHGEAIAKLHGLMKDSVSPLAGWTIPVEPLLAPLASHPAFADILGELAHRAG